MRMEDEGIIMSREAFQSLMASLRDDMTTMMEVKMKELERGVIESLKRETTKLTTTSRKSQSIGNVHQIPTKVIKRKKKSKAVKVVGEMARDVETLEHREEEAKLIDSKYSRETGYGVEASSKLTPVESLRADRLCISPEERCDEDSPAIFGEHVCSLLRKTRSLLNDMEPGRDSKHTHSKRVYNHEPLAATLTSNMLSTVEPSPTASPSIVHSSDSKAMLNEGSVVLVDPYMVAIPPETMLDDAPLTINSSTLLPPMPPSSLSVTNNVSSDEAKIRAPINSLGDREWENEVARNIITLYRANLLVNKHKTGPQEVKMMKKQRQQMEKLPLLTTRGILPPRLTVGKESINHQANKLIKRFLPKLIWFSGSGLARAVWCGLAIKHEGSEMLKGFTGAIVDGIECKHRLCHELAYLEQQGQYRKYVAIVQGLLQANIRIFGATDLEKRQWRQLVVTCNVFSQRCVEKSAYGLALDLLQKAEFLAQEDILDEGDVRMELKAFLDDAFSYYYFKRGKSRAALQYIRRSIIGHSKLKQWEHVAKCNLHQGTILAKMNKHDESIKKMGQVLTLVQNEKLEAGGATAQKICLVAVCYHNIAAEQLMLEKAHEACVSSQNARRLARLSLSYSNKWIRQFEATHTSALEALHNDKELTATFDSGDQSKLFSSLTSGLYS